MAAASPVTAFLYTDGACSDNGRPGAVAAWAWVTMHAELFDAARRGRVSSCGEVPLRQTNQRAELLAISHCLAYLVSCGAKKGPKYVICSDSNYSLKCLTEWHKLWETNGWTTTKKEPVENAELVKEALETLRSLQAKGLSIELRWVKGHSSDLGNQEADRLATEHAALLKKVGGRG